MRNDFLFGIDWAIGLFPEFEGWGTYYRTCTFDPEKVHEPKFSDLCFVHGSEEELQASKVCVIRDQLTLARESLNNPGHWIEVKPTSKAIPFESGTLIFISQTMSGNSRVVWRNEKCRKIAPRTYTRKNVDIQEIKMESLDIPFIPEYRGASVKTPLVLPQGKLWTIKKYSSDDLYPVTDWIKDENVEFFHPIKVKENTACVLLEYEETDDNVRIIIGRLPVHNREINGEFFKCSRNRDEEMFQMTKVSWISSSFNKLSETSSYCEVLGLGEEPGFRISYEYLNPVPNPYIKEESSSSGLFYDESHDPYYNNFYE